MVVHGAFFEVTGKEDELHRICAAIEANDGRLTASSSMSLDLWQEMYEEWFKIHDAKVAGAAIADANARITAALAILTNYTEPDMHVRDAIGALTTPSADSDPLESDRDRLAYLITAKRFHERGIHAAITDEEVATAIPMADFLMDEGLAFRSPELPTPSPVTDAEVRAAARYWTESAPSQVIGYEDLNSSARRRVELRMRATLEAARKAGGE